MVYRSPRHSRSEVTLDLNAIPMIDVIFMLVVFFVLVGRMAYEQNVPMKLPFPRDSQALPHRGVEQIVLNCRPADEGRDPVRVLYSLGPNPPESLEDIGRTLRSMKTQYTDQGGALQVVIRADRRLRFSDVRAAMQTVAALDIPMLNVAVQAKEER